jgi:hypothetical protein
VTTKFTRRVRIGLAASSRVPKSGGHDGEGDRVHVPYEGGWANRREGANAFRGCDEGEGGGSGPQDVDARKVEHLIQNRHGQVSDCEGICRDLDRLLAKLKAGVGAPRRGETSVRGVAATVSESRHPDEPVNSL